MLSTLSLGTSPCSHLPYSPDIQLIHKLCFVAPSMKIYETNTQFQDEFLKKAIFLAMLSTFSKRYSQKSIYPCFTMCMLIYFMSKQ